MTERIEHWITQSWDELRPVAPYLAAALVSGGSLGSVLLGLVWLIQRHRQTERRT